MAYQRNASDTVYKFICKQIRNGTWRAGDRIWTESELSQHLNVSKMAVRSAVGMLVASSILRRKQGSGTFVEESVGSMVIIQNPAFVPNRSELMEIMQFRAFFEVSNVEMFIRNATQEDVEQLEDIHNKLVQCDPNSEVFYLLDLEFHRQIASGTKNSYVMRIYEMIHDSLHLNIQLLHQIIGPSSALEYHPLIVKYILARDTEIAPLLMRRHMENALVEIMGRSKE